MEKVRVKAVYEKDTRNRSGALDPILLRFEHAEGRNSSSKLLNQVFNTAVFRSDPKKSTSKDFSHLNRSGAETEAAPKRTGNQQLVALQSSSMTYIGSNNEDESIKTYVALRQGKKMRVYEVTPITVAPFIKGHSYLVEKEKDTQIKKSKSEKKDATVDLIKSFGSKRKRLTHERLEKNKIDVSDMNESMSKASSQIKASEEEPKIKDDSVLTLIPPCNRDSKAANAVYNLEDIISPEDMENMDDLADQFLNLTSDVIEEWHSTKKYSDYFLAMWRKLVPRKSEAKTIRISKIVLYTELLISLLKLRHDQIRKKIIDLPEVFPTWLQEKALEEYTLVNAKGIRNRPEAIKDKTACYVMVLVLLANDFNLDIQLMSTSLNIHIKKLLTLAKAVGVTLNYNSTTKEHRGVLRIPLPKPIETRGRRRTLR